MGNPIVIAHHLVWTTYGSWLPNDPRGSNSKAVASDVIAQLGELHQGRKKIQPANSTIRNFYNEAENVLKFAVMNFGLPAIQLIADSFAQVVESHRYTCYACAIMPDHVHILIRKHRDFAEEMLHNLQRESRLALSEKDYFDNRHPVWGGPGWKVFLDHPDEIWRTIKYIDDNPIKVGLPQQSWRFVKAYDNWPLHEGHSPNSPYARRHQR